MFSNITIASSTIIPMDRASARREKVFRVKPSWWIKIKVPITEVGIAKSILTAEDQEPMKSQQINDVRIADNRSVKRSSSMLSRINFVVSRFTIREVSGGRVLLSSASRSFTRSAVETALTP